MTPFVLDWREACDAGAERCGGKGFNLARLVRYGFQVPRGGVVAAEVYADLLSGPHLAADVNALSQVSAGDAARPDAQVRLGTLRAAIEASRLPAPLRTELQHFL